MSMESREPVDPWQVLVEAQGESLAGAPPRRLLSREAAMERANAFLRDQGWQEVATTAWRNPLQGFWVVNYQDPAHPDAEVTGGGPLIVPTEGPVHLGSGSAPPWPEDVGLEGAEAWEFQAGEDLLGGGWDEALHEQLEEDYWWELLQFLESERGRHDVFPPPSQTFRAFALTPYRDVRVVILGQDPYPNSGQADGLAFSVPDGQRLPPSLRNIRTVLRADLAREHGEEVTLPESGRLDGWARQGVLLLNTVLTVRAGTKRDRDHHRRWRTADGHGWTTFIDAVIRAVNAKEEPVVFILWGNDAKKKRELIKKKIHTVLTSSHPSPYSARLGFLDSRPFSAANQALRDSGREIEWARSS